MSAILYLHNDIQHINIKNDTQHINTSSATLSISI